MLAGIGGGTVAEAGQNLSVAEMNAWALYERHHGPVDLGTRLDYWFDRICGLIVNRTGGWEGRKMAQPGEFTPWKPLEDKPEPSTIGGVDPGLAALIAATGAKRSKGK